MAATATLTLLRRISITVLAIGLTLLIYMVTVESEPGAIPLLMILVGAGGYFLTRARLRSSRP